MYQCVPRIKHYKLVGSQFFLLGTLWDIGTDIFFESAIFQCESTFVRVCSLSWNSLKYTNHIGVLLTSSAMNWWIHSSSFLDPCGTLGPIYFSSQQFFDMSQLLDVSATFHGVV